MRRFYLKRNVDVSGVSGVGAVLEGCQFDDLRVVVTWLSEKHVIAMYDDIETIIAIHGHNGSSEIVWIDDESSNIRVFKDRVENSQLRNNDKILHQS